MPTVPLTPINAKTLHTEDNSRARKASIIRKLPNLFPKEHKNNWFGADRFFGTNYLTGVLKGKYFITLDLFMGTEIYTVRKITPQEIETVASPLDSLEEARLWVKDKG